MDTSTKIDLLRNCNKFDWQLRDPTLIKSLDSISERKPGKWINEKGLDPEQVSAIELFSLSSQQEGFFFQPDKIKTENRQGQLKIGVL